MKAPHHTPSLALAAIFLHAVASAANFYKADNTAALNQASAWTNNAVPGPADIAVWGSNVSAANTTNSLGSNLAWAGLKILNPPTPVQLNAGFTLTNGTGGIDLSGALQGLTLSNNLVVSVPQTWSVASGQTLTLGGNLIKTVGGAISFELADGTANVVVTNATGTWLQVGDVLYGTVNNTDFAAVNGSGQIVGANTLGLYTANPTGSFNATSGSVDFSTAAAAGLALNKNTVLDGIRINQPSTADAYWTINTGTKTLSVNSILVTTNVGSQPVYVNGGGYVRIYSSGTAELLLIQNNPAAPLVFQSTVTLNQQAAGGVLVKLGAGTVQIQSASTYTGGTRIYAGTLLLSGLGTVGAGALNVFSGAFAGATGASNVAPTVVYSNAVDNVVVSSANSQFFQDASLTLSSGAHLQFSVTNGAALSATTAPLVITNTGAILYATNTVNLDLVGSLAAGQFPLIKYATLGGNGFSAFSLGSIQPHVTAYLSNNLNNSSIDLVVTANKDPLSWAAGSGVWDVATTANWEDATGAATIYQQNALDADAVVFGDTTSGASSAAISGAAITVTLNTNVFPASVTVNAAKNYTLAGLGSLSGSGALVQSGSGTLTLATTNSFTGGLFLNGGELNFSTLGNLGAGAISFSGGTLHYSGNTDDISSQTVTFNAGGANIDDGGSVISFANPVGNGGVGGLTKLGAGTLTLNGTNLYSGDTVVGTGTLALGSAGFLSDSAAIIVSNGATLDVSANSPLVLQNQLLTGGGTIHGGVFVTNGATLSPGTNGVVGTLTLNNGDLTIAGGTLALDVSASALDLIVVGGNLNFDNGTLQLNVTGTLSPGTYKLIQYSGAFGGTAGNLAITGFAEAGKTAALSSTTAGEIDLVITAAGSANLVWQGDGGNNYWDTGISANWLNGVNAAVIFANVDNVTFNDTSANQTVNLVSAEQPGWVTVNTAANYLFQDGSGVGAGKISGSTGLTKAGTGTLTVLTIDNNFGPTVITAGTLQVGNDSTTADLGTGNLTNNGAVVYAQTDNRSVAGQISGGGSLTQAGSAVLTLAANNTYSGPTTITSGTLQVGTGGAAGTLGTSTVVNNSALVVNRSGVLVLGNNQSGTGSFTTIGAGLVTLAGTNSYQGGTAVSNGVVVLGSPAALPNGALYVDGTLDLAGHDAVVTSLNGSTGIVTNSAAAGTNTLVVGDDADASTFSGVITENSGGAKIALIKQGAATLQLNGANAYSGATLVLGGQLNVGPTALVGNGASTITLSNGTTLYLANAGTSRPTVANSVAILENSTAYLNSGNLANLFTGNVLGDATASNVVAGPITFNQLDTEQFGSFSGTVVITSAGEIRFSSSDIVTLNGGDQAFFDLEGELYSKAGGTLSFGALEGAGSLSTPTSGVETDVIGAKGISSTFSGTITSGHSLVKVGAGVLTLNGSLSYDGSTTVSNGVLALASDSTALDASPAITLSASSAVIDVSGRSDDTLWLGNSSAQVLSGIGTVNGNLSEAANSTINVSLGRLNITNAATFSGAVNLLINRTNSANASEIVAQQFTVNSTATLTVTNLGPAFQGGEVFRLLSQPASFASVTLPAIVSPLSWSNRLGVDGTLVVLGTTVNTNATPLVSAFNQGTLTLSWPSDHTGWRLQAQTNSNGSGLGTNWVYVTGTSITNQTTIPVNPAGGTVFFRLVYP
jgi:autotransporter-associated beta strand protein